MIIMSYPNTLTPSLYDFRIELREKIGLYIIFIYIIIYINIKVSINFFSRIAENQM